MIRGISWRNIWRNKGRSLVVIGSIAAGIWALIFMYAFSNGFMDGYVKNQIKYETSSLQLHHPDFKKDYEIKYTVEGGEAILSALKTDPKVKAYSHRSICNGMITSPRKALGIRIRGVDPAEEASINDIDSFIVEGSYFEDVKRNPIVVGYKTAERLKIKLKSKVVLTFQDINGDIVSGAFRVVGIVKAKSPTYNDMTCLVRIEDLNRLMGIGNAFHEIAISIKRGNDEFLFTEELNKIYPNVKSEDWKKLAPELEYFQTATSSFLWILQIIIMVALIFGIVNTMLMSVLERFKELGMLMAVGMNKKRIFSMIMLETLYLAFVGTPIGIFITWLTMIYMGKVGMDLSAYSEGLEMYGYDNILYPHVDTGIYIQVIIGVFITSLLGALYPAYKAVKLKPVEALHKI